MTRVSINFRNALQGSDSDIKFEFQKFFTIRLGDLVKFGAKRLVCGFFLGIKEDRINVFSDELDPHAFVMDNELGVIKVPLYDILWFEVVSGFSEIMSGD